MNTLTVLFGIDIAGILLALLKLIADTFYLPEKAIQWLRALVVAVCVLAVGLQAQGLIFGPESEQIVLLVLSCVSAFLVTMGYGPAAVGTVVALTDLVRISAYSKMAVVLVRIEEEGQSATSVENKLKIVDGLDRRYKLGWHKFYRR